jgi:hypothetical protein
MAEIPGGHLSARPVPSAPHPHAGERATPHSPAGVTGRRASGTAEISGRRIAQDASPDAPAEATGQWGNGTAGTPGARLTRDAPHPRGRVTLHSPAAVMGRWRPGLVEERPGREALLSRLGDRAAGLREERPRWRHDPDATPSRRHATPVP